MCRQNIMPAVCEPDATMIKRDNAKPGNFEWSEQGEPHAIRRKAILDAHPEIKTLMGHCTDTKYKVVATVAFQFAVAHMLRAAPLPLLFLLTYIVSGTLNHMMTLAVHELSHSLGFKSRAMNRYCALLANIPMGIPAAISFRRYHLEHHKYQGEDDVDMDLPTPIEGWLFTSRPGKLVWLFLQWLFYAGRPLVSNPKQPGPWEFVNFALVFGVDALVLYSWGWKSLFYLVIGTLLGMGVHPVAGHFVAEHYLLHDGYETMSYYGPLNWVTFNVGYHNEHHDFPNIPGSRLHLVREYAPEFYDTLPQYCSWSKVLFDYVTRVDINPHSRSKRTTLTSEQKVELQRRELAAHLKS